MMNYKKMRMIRFLGCGLLLITACQSETAEESLATEIISEYVTYDEDDVYQAYVDADVTAIDLDKEIDAVNINEAGTYVLTGTLKDGGIQIEVTKDETVRLILQDVTITNSTGAAISCTQAKKLIVSLPEGTTNQLVDGESYADESEEAATAALYAKDDMTINGSGSLKVTANNNDAITSKDTLKLMEGNYTITSADDAIVGRDYLYIHDGSYQIDAQGDGFKTTYDTDEEKGDMIIEQGSFSVSSGNDAFQAEQNLQVYDGTFSIETGGGSVNGSSAANVNQPGGFGMWNSSSQSEDTPSAKGMKAGNSLILDGGTYEMDTSDDAFHSNGNVTINSGNYSILSGDDGLHADLALEVNGGSIEIEESVEGMEACTITINNGDIEITSSDDGLNATNSNAQGTDPLLNFHGGTVQVDASGDGLDSNGDIKMDGGKVIVIGPEDGGNAALDYDGNCTISGGTLVAVGYSSMAQAISDTSTQFSLLVNLTSTQEANSEFYITDESGEFLIGIAPTKTYNSVLISTPSLNENTTYSIYTGGSGGSVNDAGYIAYGSANGTLLETVTLNDIVTTVGNVSKMGGPGAGMDKQNNGDMMDKPGERR